jgi:SAM-dependent methyltransferase
MRKYKTFLDKLSATTMSRSEYRETLEKASRGVQTNVEVLRSVQSCVDKLLSLKDVADACARAAAKQETSLKSTEAYSKFFPWVHRDWSGSSEEEIRTVMNHVTARTRQYSNRGDRALVLGAGTGRFAWELRQEFEEVDAVDLGFPMLVAFDNILRAGLTYHRISGHCVHRRDAMVREIRIEPKPEGRESISIAVADASHTPFADGTFSVIVSIFFTDLIPLSRLIAEVRRLLRPGGILLHFGPLAYHHSKIDEWLPLEDVRTLLSSSGFEVSSEGHVPMQMFYDPAIMRSHWYENWVFAARKIT